MSRFESYLNEAVDPNIVKDIWVKLTKDCMPFLKELKRVQEPKYRFFYRGFHGSLHQEMVRKSVRTDRKPTDTPKAISKYVDDEFQKKFGWRVRSEGAFATSDRMRSSGYGTTFIFFPIGKYKYVWSEEVTDMYTYLGGRFLKYIENVFIGNDDDLVSAYPHMKKEPEEAFEDYMERRRNEIIGNFKGTVEKAMNTFQSGNMKSAMKSQSEVVFQCKEYYAVKEIYDFSLYELMEKGI